MSLLDYLPADAAPRRTGPDRWKARCSFHEDRTPSMQIERKDGRWVFFCYGCGAKGDVIRYVMETRRLGFLEAVRAMTGGNVPEAPARRLPALKDRDQVPRRQGQVRGSIVATYDYFDEVGELLYQVVRLEPKGFLQRQPHPSGHGWRWTMQGVRRVLYRLPELLAAPARPVMVVEGEKDADALVGTGRIATTNPGGAGKWRPEYSEHLRGRHVVVIPDNDGPGWKHAKAVEGSLAGKAGSVRIHRLPDAFKDVSDWLAARGGR